MGNRLISPEVAERLQCGVDQIFGLPEIFEIKKEEIGISVNALSAGKPHYKYEDTPERLMRARIVERWQLDAEGNRSEMGVLKVVMQYVFPGDSIVSADKLSVSSRDLMFFEGSTDSWISTQTEIHFEALDIVFGFASKREIIGHPQWTSINGNNDTDGRLEQFALMEPQLEHDYSTVRCTDYDVDQLTRELSTFVELERKLTTQRTA